MEKKKLIIIIKITAPERSQYRKSSVKHYSGAATTASPTTSQKMLPEGEKKC